MFVFRCEVFRAMTRAGIESVASSGLVGVFWGVGFGDVREGLVVFPECSLFRRREGIEWFEGVCLVVDLETLHEMSSLNATSSVTDLSPCTSRHVRSTIPSTMIPSQCATTMLNTRTSEERISLILSPWIILRCIYNSRRCIDICRISMSDRMANDTSGHCLRILAPAVEIAKFVDRAFACLVEGIGDGFVEMC